jgi:hypothetical protein
MSEMDPRHIFPCIAHETHFEGGRDHSFVTRDLGHGLVTMLWSDVGKVIGSVSRAGLAAMSLPEGRAWNLALENLHRVLQEGVIPLVRAEYSQEQAVVSAGAHWLASALVLHGGLHELIAEQLGTQNVHVVLPARDHALFFAGTCSPQVREEVHRVAADMASHSRTPFGENLFAYSGLGVQPVGAAALSPAGWA